jgi:ATP-dependent helicase/DNAse subunit B
MFCNSLFLNNPTDLIYIERKVLRKIFGPTKERDGTWRIKTNDELDKLIRHKNIINYIKTQRLSWFGHLHRMPEDRMAKKMCKWKPMLRRPLRTSKNRWEDYIRNDMKKLKIKNWTNCIQDRNNWKLYVEKGKTFKDWSCSA